MGHSERQRMRYDEIQDEDVKPFTYNSEQKKKNQSELRAQSLNENECTNYLRRGNFLIAAIGILFTCNLLRARARAHTCALQQPAHLIFEKNSSSHRIA